MTGKLTSPQATTPKIEKKTRQNFKSIAAEAALKAATNIENKTRSQLEEINKEIKRQQRSLMLSLNWDDVPQKTKKELLQEWLQGLTERVKDTENHNDALKTLEAATKQLRKFQPKTISEQLKSFAKSIRSPKSLRTTSSGRLR